MRTIRIMYTCNLCGVLDQGVDVREREEDENVVTWMEETCVPALAKDHERRSPGCFAETLSNLKIPISGAEYIGGGVKQ